jgi:hypothetical protein
MVMTVDIKTRYSMPSKYDVAPYGTIVKVVGDDDSYQLVVQLSKDSLLSEWMPIGKLLEGAFKDKLSDEKFIEQCLKDYALTK